MAKILAVPGAKLYYEVRGAGPVLLFIPGGNGDAAPYAPVAHMLTDTYTTVIYDRRGFSRSPLDDPADVPEDRLAIDVADITVLIDTVGHGDPAYLFGSSSGAIVGLEVLARHPERVRQLIAHEPPLMSLLPDGDEVLAFFDEVKGIAARDGDDAAMAHFGERIGLDGELPDIENLPPQVAEMIGRMRANNRFFLEHELRQYPAVYPDYARLQPESAKIRLVGGEDSRQYLPYRPNLELARHLGVTVTDLPGNHVGYATVPVQFVAALRELLPDPASEEKAPE